MTVKDKNATRYREAMSRVPMPVHVVTTDGPGGRHGATATAVASVTDAPPTLLVCLNRASTIHTRVTENAVLAVNVLSADQEAVARAFARSSGGREDDRFATGEWRTLSSGAPTLIDAVAVFDGRVIEAREIGTHTVLIVELDAVDASDDHRDGLLYHRRGYRRDRAAVGREPTPVT